MTLGYKTNSNFSILITSFIYLKYINKSFLKKKIIYYWKKRENISIVIDKSILDIIDLNFNKAFFRITINEMTK